MKTRQLTSSFSLLTLGLLATLNTGVAGVRGTACCWSNDLSCYTWKGKTADGKHWQICYKKGDHVLSQGEADVAKCLTDLHVAQATTCIDTKDTKCEVEGGVTPDIKRAQIGGFAKDVKINADTGEVIKFALDEAVKEKLYFRKSKLDWLVLARTSDNGNGASLQKLTFFSHQASGC